MADNNEIDGRAPAHSHGLNERWWLGALTLSRAFLSLIFMTYAASLPTLTREWAMTGTQAGLVQTCFTAGFGISLFMTSWLADYIGARRMFVGSCWAGAAAAFGFALFARSYEEALWLYGLVGFTQGGSYTPAIMLVAQQLPPGRRGAGVGWVLAGMSAGYIGSISLAISLIALFDYRVAFAACALGTVMGAIFGNVAGAQVADRLSGKLVEATRHLGVLWERRSLLLTVGYAGHCWELFGMWAWVPAFLIASLGDHQEGAIGLGVAIAVALHLSGLLASVTMGRASDRYDRRTVLIVVAAVGALCSFGFGWSSQLSAVLLLAFAGLYGFTALGDSSVLSTAMSEAVPAAYLGRALAIRSIVGIGIGAVAPASFGAVLDRTPPDQAWGWAFTLMGLGGVVATVCAVLLPGTSPTGSTRSGDR